MEGSRRHAHRPRSRRRLAAVLVLIAVYTVAEAVGGFLTNSLALLADAGHMLSDAVALGLSLFALWIAGRPPTPQRSYGYYRAEILAALANGAALVVISISIFLEALHRFRAPPAVLGGPMMAIAVGGLAVNLAALAILGPAREEGLNVRSAWLHVLTDALGSIGAIGGGAAILLFGWTLADPIASVAIGLLVIASAWGILKESLAVLMEGAPGHIDVDAVRSAMAGVPGVLSVHDLHIWSITSDRVALSAHLGIAEGRPPGPVLEETRRTLTERFGISHSTLQIECGECGGSCP
jgi:cobalt-zinc-cadmium efflux system protein